MKLPNVQGFEIKNTLSPYSGGDTSGYSALAQAYTNRARAGNHALSTFNSLLSFGGQAYQVGRVIMNKRHNDKLIQNSQEFDGIIRDYQLSGGVNIEEMAELIENKYDEIISRDNGFVFQKKYEEKLTSLYDQKISEFADKIFQKNKATATHLFGEAVFEAASSPNFTIETVRLLGAEYGVDKSDIAVIIDKFQDMAIGNQLDPSFKQILTNKKLTESISEMQENPMEIHRILTNAGLEVNEELFEKGIYNSLVINVITKVAEGNQLAKQKEVYDRILHYQYKINTAPENLKNVYIAEVNAMYANSYSSGDINSEEIRKVREDSESLLRAISYPKTGTSEDMGSKYANELSSSIVILTNEGATPEQMKDALKNSADSLNSLRNMMEAGYKLNVSVNFNGKTRIITKISDLEAIDTSIIKAADEAYPNLLIGRDERTGEKQRLLPSNTRAFIDFVSKLPEYTEDKKEEMTNIIKDFAKNESITNNTKYINLYFDMWYGNSRNDLESAFIEKVNIETENMGMYLLSENQAESILSGVMLKMAEDIENESTTSNENKTEEIIDSNDRHARDLAKVDQSIIESIVTTDGGITIIEGGVWAKPSVNRLRSDQRLWASVISDPKAASKKNNELQGLGRDEGVLGHLMKALNVKDENAKNIISYTYDENNNYISVRSEEGVVKFRIVGNKVSGNKNTFSEIFESVMRNKITNSVPSLSMAYEFHSETMIDAVEFQDQLGPGQVKGTSRQTTILNRAEMEIYLYKILMGYNNSEAEPEY